MLAAKRNDIKMRIAVFRQRQLNNSTYLTFKVGFFVGRLEGISVSLDDGLLVWVAGSHAV